MGQPPRDPEMARFRPPAGVSLSLFDTGVRVQGSARQAQKRRPRCWIMLWSTMIHHREGPLMQQRLVGGSPYPANVGIENRAGLRPPVADPLWCDPDAAAQTQPTNGKNPGNGGTQVGQATKGNGERPVLFWVAGGCAATAAKPWPTRPSRTTPQDGDHRGGG